MRSPSACAGCHMGGSLVAHELSYLDGRPVAEDDGGRATRGRFTDFRDLCLLDVEVDLGGERDRRQFETVIEIVVDVSPGRGAQRVAQARILGGLVFDVRSKRRKT